MGYEGRQRAGRNVTEDDLERSKAKPEDGPSEGDEASAFGAPPVASPDRSGQRRRRATTVVLGVPDSLTRSAPARRLLQGRIDSRYCLYPCYLLLFAAEICALTFTVHGNHWVPGPVALAWSCLIAWYWLYGVAYRYRRRFFRLICCTSIWTTTAGLCILSADRAQAQVAMSNQHAADQSAASGLIWAWVLTLIPSLVLVSHVLFFGRGYREKTGHFESNTSMAQEGDDSDD